MYLKATVGFSKCFSQARNDMFIYLIPFTLSNYQMKKTQLVPWYTSQSKNWSLSNNLTYNTYPYLLTDNFCLSLLTNSPSSVDR